MAELRKSIYSDEFLIKLCERITAVYSDFNTEGFIGAVTDNDWEELALKARMRKLAVTLGAFLPGSYECALEILFKVKPHCTGLEYVIFSDFVEVYGQNDDDWELSMEALERFTKLSTSEFAVRPFILRDPARMIEKMKVWAKSESEHVRRLSSEGCRPRLPWGVSLPVFKNNPTLVLEVLEILKADESKYVQKSVANNLNDIAKDHPKMVLQVAKKWIGHNKNTDWIVRHGCRTLIKKADAEIMGLFGYSAADVRHCSSATITMSSGKLLIGESSELAYHFSVSEGEAFRVRVEYGIDFIKANGKPSRKVFLLSDKTVNGGTVLHAKRKHSWADLSTRKHYPGEHKIVLLINGQEVASTKITLIGG